MKKLIVLLLIFFTFPAVSAVPGEGKLRQVVKDYKSGNYEASAARLYSLLASPIAPKIKNKSQYFAAKVFYKMKMYQLAYIYSGQIIRRGGKHPYFKKAIELLVDLHGKFGDPFIIPQTLTSYYSGAFIELDKDTLGRVHYMIGKRYYDNRKFDRAREFLNAVPKGNSMFPHSLYLLGIIEFRQGKDVQAKKYFDSILSLNKKLIKDGSMGERVRNLTYLALGRIAYEKGEFKKSVEFYESVKRFGSDWFDSLFEVSWAHFMREDYGKSLGGVHSVTSPYFEHYFIPEALVLKSTIYIENCLYRETNKAIQEYKTTYDLIQKKLASYIKVNKKASNIYRDIVDLKRGKVPLKISNYLLNVGRFQKVYNLVAQANAEVTAIKARVPWSKTMKQDLMRQVERIKMGYESLAGRYAKVKLKEILMALQDFSTTIQTIEVQMTLDEKDLIVSTKDFTGLLKEDKAKAIPRTDQYVYWSFNDEYWLDELGYYEYTIRGACKQ